MKMHSFTIFLKKNAQQVERSPNAASSCKKPQMTLPQERSRPSIHGKTKMDAVTFVIIVMKVHTYVFKCKQNCIKLIDTGHLKSQV